MTNLPFSNGKKLNATVAWPIAKQNCTRHQELWFGCKVLMLTFSCCVSMLCVCLSCSTWWYDMQHDSTVHFNGKEYLYLYVKISDLHKLKCSQCTCWLCISFLASFFPFLLWPQLKTKRRGFSVKGSQKRKTRCYVGNWNKFQVHLFGSSQHPIMWETSATRIWFCSRKHCGLFWFLIRVQGWTSVQQ